MARLRARMTLRAPPPIPKDKDLLVLVRDNNVDQAMRVLKKKLQREGVFREIKKHRHYEKPSERISREKGEAIRRARKLARKKMIREGLIAPPKKPAQAATRSKAAPLAGVADPIRSP